MARQPNLRTTEDQTILSGPCVQGRPVGAGGGPAQELTAAQQRELLKLDGVDATGFLGNLTTTQIEALTGLSAWQWAYDTTIYRRVVYNGTIWVPDSAVVLINKTGGASIQGRGLQVSTSVDFGVVHTNQSNDTDTIGVMYSGGIADGSPVAVLTSMIRAQVMMAANDDTGVGQVIQAQNNGLFDSRTGGDIGQAGIALESKNDTSPYLIEALIGTTEVY